MKAVSVNWEAPSGKAYVGIESADLMRPFIRVRAEPGRGVRCFMAGLESASTTPFLVTLDLPSTGVRTMVKKWTTLADFPAPLTKGYPMTLQEFGRTMAKGLGVLVAGISSLFNREGFTLALRLQEIQVEGRALGMTDEDIQGIIRTASLAAARSTGPESALTILDRYWTVSKRVWVTQGSLP